MVNKTKQILILCCILSICIASLLSCLEIFNSDSFELEKWNIKVIGSKTIIFLEFETNLNNGVLYLYNPLNDLIDRENISQKNKNSSIVISKHRSLKPLSGKYKLVVNKNENGVEEKLVEKILIIQDSNILITQSTFSWSYNEGYDMFDLDAVNLTIINNGDLYGFIYEGRIIVDNKSIFIAPDYHWHSLNLWLKPKKNISITLPVEVPYLDEGNHFVKIFLQDKELNTVSYYESNEFTPNI